MLACALPAGEREEPGPQPIGVLQSVAQRIGHDERGLRGVRGFLAVGELRRAVVVQVRRVRVEHGSKAAAVTRSRGMRIRVKRELTLPLR